MTRAWAERAVREGRRCLVETPHRHYPRNFEIRLVGAMTVRLKNDVEEYVVSKTGLIAAIENGVVRPLKMGDEH